MISNYNGLNELFMDIIEQLKNEDYEYIESSVLSTEYGSQNEFILERRLHRAMARLNPHASDEEVTNHLQTILNIKASSLMEANQIFYDLMVTIPSKRSSNIQHEPLKIIDFNSPANNEFLFTTEFLVGSNQGKIILDLVIFINGLPLVIMEGINKNEMKSAISRFESMQKNYKELFYYNQLMFVTNTFKETQIGLVPSTWGDIREWIKLFPELFIAFDQEEDHYISFVVKREFLLHLIQKGILYERKDGTLTKKFARNLISPNGEGAINDRITHIDLLGRDDLIRELSNFYTEYSEQNPFPFYFGIFGRWGMGKSSVNEILTKKIQEYSSEEYEHLVLKIDCSLFHKKDKLWISILNDLLDLLSKREVKEKVFQSKFPSIKLKFLGENLKSWLKGNWWSWSFLLPIISLSYILYCLYTASFPKMLQPKDFKETAAMVSIVTFIYGLLKTVSLLIKQNIFLRDNRNENSSYVQSLKEYKQLIALMNNMKKKKDIKILIILDELDRIHKDLLPDIIELIQIFKGLNNNFSLEKNNEKKLKKENRSVISFVFSFNHDILFPVIGRNVALNDRQLLVSSYKKYNGFVEGTEKDAYVDYYKLGKEFMDKYLDLSIYLEREIDYTRLVKELFGGVNKPNSVNQVMMDEPSLVNDYATIKHYGLNMNEGRLASTMTTRDRQEMLENLTPQPNANMNRFISFSESEIEFIMNTINKYAAKVEPRKVIRLKNALIMLKKLNKQENIEVNTRYRDELEKFIIEFLDINVSEGGNTDKNGEEKRGGDKYIDSNSNKYLKFTEYFIHKTS